MCIRDSSYGIADCGGIELKGGDSVKINSIVEKPSVEEAPSNLAVVGRYVFSAETVSYTHLLRQIVTNAGEEASVVASAVKNGEGNFGYNAGTEPVSYTHLRTNQ